MPQIEAKLEHCEADDPNRCQGVGANGQCPFFAHPGSKFCLRHGGNKAAEQANKQAIRNYRLAAWRVRAYEFAVSDILKSLREEIGITRMTLEYIINACQEPTDLIIRSDKISGLVDKIERLVLSCQKMEERTGALLDKTSVLNLADQICEIIGTVVPQEQLEQISNKILATIAKFNEPTENV